MTLSCNCALLNDPPHNLDIYAQFDGSSLVAEGVSADLGRQGRLTVQGHIPLHPDGVVSSLPSTSPSATGGGESEQQEGPEEGGLLEGYEVTPELPQQGGTTGEFPPEKEDNGVKVRVHGLELRVRGLYTGALDADLDLDGCLTAPLLGGWARLSRGTASLVPPSPPSAVQGGVSFPLPGDSTSPQQRSAGNGNGGGYATSSRESAVQSAFSLLKAGRRRALAGGPGASAPPHAASGKMPLSGSQPFDSGFSDGQLNGASSTVPMVGSPAGGGSALHLSDLAVQVGVLVALLVVLVTATSILVHTYNLSQYLRYKLYVNTVSVVSYGMI